MADRNDVDVARTLGRIESKLDRLCDQSEDQEARIRVIERRSAWLAGAAAVVGAVGGAVWSALFGTKGH
jgi:hypothetical protein